MKKHSQFHDQGLSGMVLADGLLQLETERYDDAAGQYAPGLLTFSGVSNATVDDQAAAAIVPLSDEGEIIHVATDNGQAFLIILWDANRKTQKMTFYRFSFDTMQGSGSAVLEK